MTERLPEEVVTHVSSDAIQFAGELTGNKINVISDPQQFAEELIEVTADRVEAAIRLAQIGVPSVLAEKMLPPKE